MYITLKVIRTGNMESFEHIPFTIQQLQTSRTRKLKSIYIQSDLT